ncbi:hypothetical protein KDH_05670 [Dictyobacter sp. S3.2.2.5]|uniref:Uncharacterized protein n=1 Tax=Dictyobacter halimunensis TaxID=3026934 RepID=A0ABQ6FJG0_9CHLR|nr:hypothetical protein KDH_05670 [Dictyobacter sp. S3.2.2.5]
MRTLYAVYPGYELAYRPFRFDVDPGPLIYLVGVFVGLRNCLMLIHRHEVAALNHDLPIYQ